MIIPNIEINKSDEVFNVRPKKKSIKLDVPKISISKILNNDFQFEEIINAKSDWQLYLDKVKTDEIADLSSRIIYPLSVEFTIKLSDLILVFGQIYKLSNLIFRDKIQYFLDILFYDYNLMYNDTRIIFTEIIQLITPSETMIFNLVLVKSSKNINCSFVQKISESPV